MTDSQNEKLDMIIQMLGQMQRTLGPLAGDVQAIRKELAAKEQVKTSPEQLPMPPKRP